MQWFNVDKEGLSKLLEGKGKEFVLYELIQNALDENSHRVDVVIERIPKSPFVNLVVADDNPMGFSDLSHAFTLFAESTKKGDVSKRGRFNLGEKLVLSMCETASIESTTGTIVFDEKGRHKKRAKLDKGSKFSGKMRMTNDEIDNVINSAKTLIIPSDKQVFVNGNEIKSRNPIHAFEATLATELSNSDGVLKKTSRKTVLEIYEPSEAEDAWLYEMGIPVVATGDKYHINVCQKIPLNMNRDNVTEGYKKTLRTLVFNEMHEHLESDQANDTWVREALNDDRINEDAVKSAITKRFGEKVVAFDPSDSEANKLAVSQGYTVIHGGHLSKNEWENVRKASAILPAGKVTPSPKPYSDDPLAPAVKELSENEITDGMKKHMDLAFKLGKALLGKEISIRMVKPQSKNFIAAYGGSSLQFAVNVLGKPYFDKDPMREEFLSLLIHEFGHDFSGDHLSSAYHDALCDLGAKLAIFLSTTNGHTEN
ncbi:hypothetical protein A3715_17330 [Oleiphilus sp. HI0009]|nr:hypothetical protein A3715_17330 [Oleiphilus sp. HI0009]